MRPPCNWQSSLYLLSGVLLVALLTAGEENTTPLPALLEVDLVFPRNNTSYKPLYPFPIVFALRGFSAALHYGLDMADIEWSIQPVDGNATYDPSTGILSADSIARAAAQSEATSYWISESEALKNVSTTAWALAWHFNMAPNCSTPLNTTDNYNGTTSDGVITFNVSDSGRLPDIVPGDGSCPLPMFAWNIEDHKDYYGDDGRGCFVLNDWDNPPTRTPCAMNATTALAANVTSIMQRAMCQGRTWPDPSFNGYCLGGGPGFLSGARSAALLSAFSVAVTLLLQL